MTLPFLDPERIPAEAWHQLPLTAEQYARVEENYRRSMMRRWDTFRPTECPGHVWSRQIGGIWTCDRCPEWRRSL